MAYGFDNRVAREKEGGMKFHCVQCGREYHWWMQGGTFKLCSPNSRTYWADKDSRCCYCAGVYVDGTRTNGGNK